MKNDIKHVIVLQDVSSKRFLGIHLPFRRDKLVPLAYARLFRTAVSAQKVADRFNARLKGSGFKKRYVVRFISADAYDRAPYCAVPHRKAL